MTRSRASLGEDQVAFVFRELANEHAARRQDVDKPRAWRRLRTRLNESELRARPRARAWQLWVPMATLASAVAAAVVLMAPRQLEYELIGGSVEDGLIHTAQQTALLDFSDDSEIQVGEETTLNVSVVGEQSALTRLARGNLRVKVEHRDKTDWRFLAGPYEVRVIGTEFDIEWQPDSAQLDLNMREGKVQIHGPDHTVYTAVAGQSLRLGGEKLAKNVQKAAAPERPAEEASENVEEKTDEPRRLATRRGATAKVDVADAKASWAGLVARGDFAGVVEAAEQMGISQALGTNSAADLQALAQAARYSGRTALAQRAWRTLRERFAGQGHGRQAAFFLGRSYDQQGQPSEALRWLNTYLREAPSGVYAAEALGRKLTLVQRLKGRSAATELARSYLKRFPDGAYAQSARGIIHEE